MVQAPSTQQQLQQQIQNQQQQIQELPQLPQQLLQQEHQSDHQQELLDQFEDDTQDETLEIVGTKEQISKLEDEDLDLLADNSSDMTLNHLNMHENEVDVESITSSDLKLDFENEEVTPDVIN